MSALRKALAETVAAVVWLAMPEPEPAIARVAVLPTTAGGAQRCVEPALEAPNPTKATQAPRSTAAPADWLTPAEAARVLGCHPNSIRNWAHAQRLDAMTTPGGQLRISRRSVEQFLFASLQR